MDGWIHISWNEWVRLAFSSVSVAVEAIIIITTQIRVCIMNLV